MKNNVKLIAVSLLAMFLTVVSCSENETSIEEIQNFKHLPEDVLNKVLELQLDPSDFQYREVEYPDGTLHENVIIDDIIIERRDFLNRVPSEGVIVKRYRTEFIVDTDIYPTIDIFAFTGGGGFGLSETAQQGLIDAVENWNAIQNTTIELNIVFDSNIANYDTDEFETLVFVDPNAGDGYFGEALFPSEDGAPGAALRISTEANTTLGLPNAIEHLFTHELGHAIGLRHSDWDTRRSCVELGIQEEESSESAVIDIFSTPIIEELLDESEANSIMNACFGLNTTDGELTRLDAASLFNLYLDPFYNDGTGDGNLLGLLD
ncbi:M57 family metalloprotease [uncultured Kordia sp.]|uniref:M57 family metalloprotease n=1 Tax=uncultured Kordia sp. TaxID=507699 RepID=UPI00261EA23D|nr:M57 family metalloprotease [uncultured Kordia sp.]